MTPILEGSTNGRSMIGPRLLDFQRRAEKGVGSDRRALSCAPVSLPSPTKHVAVQFVCAVRSRQLCILTRAGQDIRADSPQGDDVSDTPAAEGDGSITLDHEHTITCASPCRPAREDWPRLLDRDNGLLALERVCMTRGQLEV